LFVVLGLLAGCGRVAFDEILLATDAGMDPDAVAARPCGLPETAPPTITISGTTFEYTMFNNTSRPIGPAMVTLHDVPSTGPIVQVTSLPTGEYALGVVTNGVPKRVALRYAMSGYFTTTVIADLELAQSTVGGGVPLWSFGDAPMWSNLAMTMVYQSGGGRPRNSAKGTLNIAVRDCAGQPVPGVTVTIDPPPIGPDGEIRYQGDDGAPLPASATATSGQFGHVLVFNAEPGPTRIIATKAGRTFLDRSVEVLAGSNNTLATVRAVD